MLTLIPRFDPGKALEIMQRDRVTIFEGVPTMYSAMLHHPERDEFDLSSLRVCASGGAAMPVEVLRGFEEAFGCKVLEGYGLSRDLAGRLVQPPGPAERKPGSIGTPIEGVEMKVVDDDGKDLPARRGRRDRHPRPQRDEGLLEARRTRRPRRSATAGSTPATWRRSTRTATSSSSTARRT